MYLGSITEEGGFKPSKITKTGAFDKAVNMMMVYSLDYKLPSYYRLLPGNIKDVKAFKICMQESGASSATAIIDKTFPSVANHEFLEGEKIKYIASLLRSTKGLDYTVFENRTNKNLDGHFKYRGRTLWYKEAARPIGRVGMEYYRVKPTRFSK